MKKKFVWAAPLIGLAVGIGFYAFDVGDAGAAWTVGITVLTALWWITESVPIPAASLVPLALFPLSGVLTSTQVGESYGSHLVLLMMGGFMLSSAMERSGAHRRMALKMVSLFGGGGGRQLVFGFIATSGLLSMWITNSAATLMLLPIALAILEQSNDKRLHISLLLGIAYAASVGGVGTPIGTPPNLVFLKVYSETTGGAEIAFVDWMKIAAPVVFVMLPVLGFWLTRNLQSSGSIELPQVGEWRAEEVRTLVVFAVTAVFWITRTQPLGGWSQWTGMTGANDASVALVGVVAMFLIPNGKGQGEKLLDWPTAAQIPWGILILFGGGITIAKAFVESGLSHQLGNQLAGVGQFPLFLLIAIVCLSVTFLTEVTSNTATTSLLMPILAAAAVAAEMEPQLFMIPATISASFAFMLPVATPPNAIVFGCEKFTVKEMAREGLMLNLLGVIVVAVLCYFTI